jgi:hypothetical protein
MNAIQEFTNRAMGQAQGILQEEFTLGGNNYFGTFSAPILQPIMTATGYQDQLVVTLKVRATLFTAAPKDKQKLVRKSNNREYFVQIVDFTNPAVFTFLLTDRVL